MDIQGLLDELNQFIGVIDEYVPFWSKLVAFQQLGPSTTAEGTVLRQDVTNSVAKLQDQIRGLAAVLTAVADRSQRPEFAARLSYQSDGGKAGHPWYEARCAAVEWKALLTNEQRIEALVGPQGPKLAAEHLHPDIWKVATPHWDNGHPEAAVQAASIFLEGMLQKHNPKLAGKKLGSLFSSTNSASPRLRVRGIDEANDPQTFSSLHDGLQHLVSGSMQAIRNVVSHPNALDLTTDECLEMLATLSYLARMVDRSERTEGG